MKIALISAPWHLANRPAAGLGALKGYLAQCGAPVDTYHLHLIIAANLGLTRYNQIAWEWRLAESLYATLVAPAERQEIIARLKQRLQETGRAEVASWVTSQFCEQLGQLTEKAVADLRLSRYEIVGLSVAHLQLMSSLYIARLIKRANPGVTVIFGGRGVSGEVGRNLLAQCQDVSLIVDGEGEEALLQIAQLSPPLTDEKLEQVPNLWLRTSNGDLKHTPRSLLPSMEEVAIPDFSDYFDAADQMDFAPPSLVLPVEGSRGCAWEHRGEGGTALGCAFCGLNSNWPNYREKPLERVLQEVESGVARYRTLDVSFSDAFLPDSYRKDLLKALIASRKDFTVFCEMRPGFDEETAQLLARVGTRTIQIGIEAFSTSLLARLGKGVRAIDNVNTLKMCEEYRIPYQYNLLVEVPGITSQEVDETLAILPLLYALQPPTLAPLYLSRGSRMYQTPEAFGIALKHLNEAGCEYFPRALARAKISEQVLYTPPRSSFSDNAWKKIAERVAAWQQVRQKARVPLSYRDGGDVVIVSDFRGVEPRWVTLEGTVKEIFLTCRRVISMRQLQERLPHIDAAEIAKFIEKLAGEGLVLREGDRVLALPVRAPSPSGNPMRSES